MWTAEKHPAANVAGIWHSIVTLQCLGISGASIKPQGQHTHQGVSPLRHPVEDIVHARYPDVGNHRKANEGGKPCHWVIERGAPD